MGLGLAASPTGCNKLQDSLWGGLRARFNVQWSVRSDSALNGSEFLRLGYLNLGFEVLTGDDNGFVLCTCCIPAPIKMLLISDYAPLENI